MIKQMRQKAKDNWSYILITFFILVTIVYVLVRGENIYIQVHDNLDSNIAQLKMMRDNKLFLETGAMVPLLGGIDRNYMVSELKIYNWLYIIFPTFQALIIGWYMKVIMSIIGFAFLGKVVYSEYNEKKQIIIWCGFLYGILPTFPTAAFGFASLPFLLGVLILLYRDFKYCYLIALLLYTMFSEFIAFGIFACGFILIIFIMDWIIQKKPKWRMILAIIMLSLGYIITEWRLFYVMLFAGVNSIRKGFYSTTQMGAVEIIKDTLSIFVCGQYHAGSLHAYVVFPVCFFYFIFLNMQYIKHRERKEILFDKFNWLILWIVFNTIIYGLDRMDSFKKFIRIIIPPLDGFQFSRTIWFNPLLWYLAFMVILCRLEKKWLKYTLCILAAVVLCIGSEMYNPLYYNLGQYVYKIIKGKDLSWLTYKEFYSQGLFEQIKEDIGYDGEWSIAYGMHPAVIEYNGIATLDGYLSYYSMDYKEKFRKLIEPDLKVDKANADYFDSWGARAYIFSKEISYSASKEMEKESADLLIDTDIFKEMDGKYIFSRVKVENADELGIGNIGVFTDESSPYTIYVYEILD